MVKIKGGKNISKGKYSNSNQLLTRCELQISDAK